MDTTQQKQDEQYRLPYHYIPNLANGRFSQHLYWDWGFRYLGGLHLVQEELEKLTFSSLVDIGCGDGRFLREIKRKHPEIRLLGVDYSKRAIRLASALNPDICFRQVDICRDPVNEGFDVGTLIEVLEHIKPSEISSFLGAVQNLLAQKHVLIVTVPHKNKRLIEKHYQHFDEYGMRAALQPFYKEMRVIPFDVPASCSLGLTLITKMIGGRGKLWILTNRGILTWVYNLYLKFWLHSKNEKCCERIAVVCRK